MPNYTVKDTQTGKTITFAWDGEAPPTDADMEQVFSAARAKKPTYRESGNYNATPDEYEAQRRRFVQEQGTVLQRAKEYIPTRKTLADFTRPGLEGTGAVIGGLAGVPLAPASMGTAPILGAGLGYAIGKNIADQIEGDNAKTWGEAVTRTAKDIGTGAEYEMGGQILGAGAGQALNAFRQVKANGIPFTDKWSQRKAGEMLNERLAPTVERVNTQAATDEVLGRIGTDAVPTPAQATGSMEMGALEQAAIAKNPMLAGEVARNNAELNRAAQSNLYRTVGANKPAPIIQTVPDSTTGENILASINTAQEPVKAAEREAWAAVPDYAMPTTALDTEIAALKSEPMPQDVQGAVNNIIGYIKGSSGGHHGAPMPGVPNTVEGLRSAEQTITGAISKAVKAGDNNTARQLYRLKNAIGEDFNALGEAATNGDIALYNGNIVMPSKLQGELADIGSRISAESAKSAVPDIPAIVKALQAKGVPFMRQVAEPEATYAQRMVAAYNKSIGGEIPTASSVNSKVIDGLTARQTQIQDILANLQPAEDTAAAIANAKKVSLAKNEQFNRGATKDVLQRGDEFIGTRSAPETIPQQFFTETGANDLVRAVGRDEASRQMLPYVQGQLSKFSDNNGIMNIPRAMAWIRQNKTILTRTGTADGAMQTIRQQIPASIKAAIESKAKVDVAGNPFITAREGLKMIRDFAPAMKTVYGKDGGKQLLALRDYQKVVAMLGRNQNVTGAGNSTSIEKLFGDAPPSSMAGRIFNEVTGAITGSLAGAALHGGAGAGIGGALGLAAGKGISAARAHALDTVKNLLADAITNPESAKLLMDIAKRAKVTPAQINSHLVTYGLIAATPQDETSNQPQ